MQLDIWLDAVKYSSLIWIKLHLKISQKLILGQGLLFQLFNIPLTMMRGNRPLENTTLLDSWSWAQPYYIFELNISKGNIQEVVIDPLGFTADVNRKNNRL